jgi:hypothetical protein
MISDPRAVLRVQLDSSAKLELDRLTESYGMTQIEVLARLFEWFVRQPEVIQLSALRILSPELLAPLAARALAKASDSRDEETMIDQGIPLNI